MPRITDARVSYSGNFPTLPRHGMVRTMRSSPSIIPSKPRNTAFLEIGPGKKSIKSINVPLLIERNYSQDSVNFVNFGIFCRRCRHGKAALTNGADSDMTVPAQGRADRKTGRAPAVRCFCVLTQAPIRPKRAIHSIPEGHFGRQGKHLRWPDFCRSGWVNSVEMGSRIMFVAPWSRRNKWLVLPGSISPPISA